MLKPSVGGNWRRRYLPLANLVMGTAAGGAALGALLMGIRHLAESLSVPARTIALGLGALALAASVVPGLEQRVPERRCQVSAATAFRYGLPQAALRWGVRLGAGLCTYVVVPGFWALLAASLVQESPTVGWMLCTAYGLARGSVIAGFAVARAGRESRGDAEVLPLGALKRSLRFPLAIGGGVVVVAALMTS